MSLVTRTAAAVLILALTGCASQGSLDNVRNDVDAVKTRLFSVEKDLGGIRDDSRATEKNVKTDVASVRKLSADMQAAMDSSKTEMRMLNGRIDDIALTAKKPAEDLARYKEDADKRILALEERISKLQAALEKGGLPAPNEGSAATPDGIYKKGLELFKAGNMPAAREQFTILIEKHPKHDMVANAHYWTGETLYGEKQYEQAILAFQEVIKNFPQQPKVPAAMLKQALAFRAIKDNKSAKYVLKRLVAKYPKSQEAKKAKTLLKQIK